MLTAGLLALAIGSQSDFVQKQLQWRADRQASLLKPAGWLAVAGLFWLHEGDQTIGSGEKCDIRLPKPAPELVGVITLAKDAKLLTEDIALIRPHRGVEVLINGSPGFGKVKIDSDKIQIGELQLMVIKRGKRVGIRLWDPNAKARRAFQGCRWFDPNSNFVVKAKYVLNPVGTTLTITNVLGDTEPTPNPGYVEFKLNGATCKLQAIAEGDGLFFNFKDLTSGMETYPAGRFLNSDGPRDGFVTMDFNQAVNPPCAFTAFATCPLPPAGNLIKVRVTAGEMTLHP